jgi:hypothetical protein
MTDPNSKPWYASAIIWAALIVLVLPELMTMLNTLFPEYSVYINAIIGFVLSVFIIWQRVTSQYTSSITLT